MKFLCCIHVVSPLHSTDQLRPKAIVSPIFLSNSVPFSRISKSEAEQASWRGLDVVMLTRRVELKGAALILSARQRAIGADSGRTEHSIVFWQISCRFV